MKLLVLPAALLVLGLGILGCSSSDDDDGGGGTSSEPTRSATAQNDGPVSSSTAQGGGSTATVQAVSVRASENGNAYSFEVSNSNLKTGKVKVTLTNAGPERPHTFVVKKSDGTNLAEISETQPGGTGTVEFDLTAAGTYQFQCDLRGHADRGQRGSFTVTQ